MILECRKRENKGKEYTKKIRVEKEVPGVIYGKKTDPLMIQFKENEFVKFIRESHGKPVLKINVDGEEKTVVIKEKQEKIWKNQIIHVDFQEIHKGEIVHLTIPIHFLNADVCEKKGGIVVKNMHEINIACYVKDIPEKIEVDLSNLEIHESVHVKDLNLNENIRISEEEDRTVCSVTLPRAAVENTGSEDETAETAETPEA